MRGMATGTIVGRLVADPDDRYAGTYRVARIVLAVNKKSGKEHDDDPRNVAYFDCELWSDSEGKGGYWQVAMEYLAKGDAVAVAGDLWQDRWEDKDTEKIRAAVKLTVRTLSLLGSPKGEGNGKSPAKAPAKPNGKKPSKQPARRSAGEDTDGPPF